MTGVEGSGALPVNAQVTFFYYADLAAPENFYGALLGFPKTFDKGWVRFFQLTPHSYVGLVDETRGHHKKGGEKSVMLSIETDALEGWHARARAGGTPFQVEPDFADTARLITNFMLTDPGGYTVEFFRFNRRE